MLTRNYKLKCDYCGKFISDEDLQNGIAEEDAVKLHWDYGSEVIIEEYPAWHILCKRKSEGVE